MSYQLTQEEKEIIIEDARYGDLETLQEIFSELGGSLIVEINDSEKVTPIHMACANGHYETVKYLLEQVPKDHLKQLVNAQNNEGNTPLHWAALNGHLNVVQLLCDEYDADAFIKNKFEHDAIYEAENSGKEDVETYFLNKFDVEPEDGEIDIKVSNNDVEVKPGKEIDQISKEQMENIESNEKFLEERTANMKI